MVVNHVMQFVSAKSLSGVSGIDPSTMFRENKCNSMSLYVCKELFLYIGTIKLACYIQPTCICVYNTVTSVSRHSYACGYCLWFHLVNILKVNPCELH